MKRNLTNLLGICGYLSLVIQWLWLCVTLGMPLLQSEWFRMLFLPDKTQPTIEVHTVAIPEPLAVIFMILAVVFAVGMSMYAILAVPRSIAKTGKKMTVSTARVTIPRVTHHKPISQKRQKTLAERISWAMKFGAAGVPLFAAFIPVSGQLPLNQSIVSSVAVLCAACTFVWFGGQFVLTRLFKLDAKDVW